MLAQPRDAVILGDQRKRACDGAAPAPETESKKARTAAEGQGGQQPSPLERRLPAQRAARWCLHELIGTAGDIDDEGREHARRVLTKWMDTCRIDGPEATAAWEPSATAGAHRGSAGAEAPRPLPRGGYLLYALSTPSLQPGQGWSEHDQVVLKAAATLAEEGLTDCRVLELTCRRSVAADKSLHWDGAARAFEHLDSPRLHQGSALRRKALELISIPSAGLHSGTGKADFANLINPRSIREYNHWGLFSRMLDEQAGREGPPGEGVACPGTEVAVTVYAVVLWPARMTMPHIMESSLMIPFTKSLLMDLFNPATSRKDSAIVPQLQEAAESAITTSLTYAICSPSPAPLVSALGGILERFSPAQPRNIGAAIIAAMRCTEVPPFELNMARASEPCQPVLAASVFTRKLLRDAVLTGYRSEAPDIRAALGNPFGKGCLAFLREEVNAQTWAAVSDDRGLLDSLFLLYVTDPLFANKRPVDALFEHVGVPVDPPFKAGTLAGVESVLSISTSIVSPKAGVTIDRAVIAEFIGGLFRRWASAIEGAGHPPVPAALFHHAMDMSGDIADHPAALEPYMQFLEAWLRRHVATDLFNPGQFNFFKAHSSVVQLRSRLLPGSEGERPIANGCLCQTPAGVMAFSKPVIKVLFGIYSMTRFRTPSELFDDLFDEAWPGAWPLPESFAAFTQALKELARFAARGVPGGSQFVVDIVQNIAADSIQYEFPSVSSAAPDLVGVVSGLPESIRGPAAAKSIMVIMNSIRSGIKRDFATSNSTDQLCGALLDLHEHAKGHLPSPVLPALYLGDERHSIVVGAPCVMVEVLVTLWRMEGSGPPLQDVINHLMGRRDPVVLVPSRALDLIPALGWLYQILCREGVKGGAAVLGRIISSIADKLGEEPRALLNRTTPAEAVASLHQANVIFEFIVAANPALRVPAGRIIAHQVIAVADRVSRADDSTSKTQLLACLEDIRCLHPARRADLPPAMFSSLRAILLGLVGWSIPTKALPHLDSVWRLDNDPAQLHTHLAGVLEALRPRMQVLAETLLLKNHSDVRNELMGKVEWLLPALSIVLPQSFGLLLRTVLQAHVDVQVNGGARLLPRRLLAKAIALYLRTKYRPAVSRWVIQADMMRSDHKLHVALQQELLRDSLEQFDPEGYGDARPGHMHLIFMVTSPEFQWGHLKMALMRQGAHDSREVLEHGLRVGIDVLTGLVYHYKPSLEGQLAELVQGLLTLVDHLQQLSLVTSGSSGADIYTTEICHLVLGTGCPGAIASIRSSRALATYLEDPSGPSPVATVATLVHLRATGALPDVALGRASGVLWSNSSLLPQVMYRLIQYGPSYVRCVPAPVEIFEAGLEGARAVLGREKLGAIGSDIGRLEPFVPLFQHDVRLRLVDLKSKVQEAAKPAQDTYGDGSADVDHQAGVDIAAEVPWDVEDESKAAEFMAVERAIDAMNGHDAALTQGERVGDEPEAPAADVNNDHHFLNDDGARDNGYDEDLNNDDDAMMNEDGAMMNEDGAMMNDGDAMMKDGEPPIEDDEAAVNDDGTMANDIGETGNEHEAVADDHSELVGMPRDAGIRDSKQHEFTAEEPAGLSKWGYSSPNHDGPGSDQHSPADHGDAPWDPLQNETASTTTTSSDMPSRTAIAQGTGLAVPNPVPRATGAPQASSVRREGTREVSVWSLDFKKSLKYIFTDDERRMLIESLKENDFECPSADELARLATLTHQTIAQVKTVFHSERGKCSGPDRILRVFFDRDPNPSEAEMARLAPAVDLPPKKVAKWFERNRDLAKKRQVGSERLRVLKESFGRDPNPDPTEMARLAIAVGLSEGDTNDWFGHQRDTVKALAKEKRDLAMLHIITDAFSKNPHPGPHEVAELAARSQWSEGKVRKWFYDERLKLLGTPTSAKGDQRGASQPGQAPHTSARISIEFDLLRWRNAVMKESYIRNPFPKPAEISRLAALTKRSEDKVKAFFAGQQHQDKEQSHGSAAGGMPASEKAGSAAVSAPRAAAPDKNTLVAFEAHAGIAKRRAHAAKDVPLAVREKRKREERMKQSADRSRTLMLESYARNTFPEPREIIRLAVLTNRTVKQVKGWFASRRFQDKKRSEGGGPSHAGRPRFIYEWTGQGAGKGQDMPAGEMPDVHHGERAHLREEDKIVGDVDVPMSEAAGPASTKGPLERPGPESAPVHTLQFLLHAAPRRHCNNHNFNEDQQWELDAQFCMNPDRPEAELRQIAADVCGLPESASSEEAQDVYEKVADWFRSCRGAVREHNRLLRFVKRQQGIVEAAKQPSPDHGDVPRSPAAGAARTEGQADRPVPSPSLTPQDLPLHRHVMYSFTDVQETELDALFCKNQDPTEAELLQIAADICGFPESATSEEAQDVYREVVDWFRCCRSDLEAHRRRLESATDKPAGEPNALHIGMTVPAKRQIVLAQPMKGQPRSAPARPAQGARQAVTSATNSDGDAHASAEDPSGGVTADPARAKAGAEYIWLD